MASDVQGWLDSPSTSFGWLLKGNETQTRTTKRFDSRQNGTPSSRPVLSIQYTPAPPAQPAALSVADVTVQEDVGAAVLTVSLDKASTTDVTVQVDTQDGTAIAPGDYTAVVGRTVTVPAGATSITTTVPIIDDTLDELDETFTVTLSGPTSGAVIGDGSATVTVVDDDEPAPTPVPGVMGWGLMALAALLAASVLLRSRMVRRGRGLTSDVGTTKGD